MAFCLRSSLLAAAIWVLPVGAAWANLPLQATPVDIDFTGFTGAGFAPAPAAGQLDSDFWVVRGLSDGNLAFGASGTMNDFAEGQSSGPEVEGGVFAFDVGPSVALGASASSDDFSPGSFVLRVQNDTGQTIDAIEVTFDVWFLNSGDRAMSFDFAWSLDDSAYTDVGSLGFNTPGNDDALGWTSDPGTTVIEGIDLADGENIFLRWTFDAANGGGEYDELAIDDLQIVALGVCGNGIPEGAEECDDGNASSTDACVEGCLDASCGDGFVQGGVEGCDDGNMDNTDACPDGAGGTCENAVCGDGFTQNGVEDCDDANGNNTDACVQGCAAASCGDGFVQAGVEGCDDGNMDNTDACPDGGSGTCADAVCGDGFTQNGVEECDDANGIDDDACANDCTSNVATTTDEPSTGEPTTGEPTTGEPTTGEPTTSEPTTNETSGATTDEETSAGTDGTTSDGTTTGGTTSTSSSTDPTLPATSGDTDGMLSGEEPPGCTCRSGGQGSWLLLPLFGLAALRRRRSR